MQPVEEASHDSGHLNNLTVEQEKTLFSFWNRILEYLGKPLDDKDRVGLSKKQIKEKDKQEKKLKDLSKSLEQVQLYDSMDSMVSVNTRNALSMEFWGSIGREDVDVFLLRFLRARKWSLEAAFDMIIGCLKWRLQIDMRKVVMEGEMGIKTSLLQSGKTYFHGVDKQNRLVGWIKVGLHDKNGQTVEENEKFTIFQMESGRLLFPKNTETVTMVFDMSEFSLQCMDYPSLKFLIGCMEAYYPESLGVALVLNAPWIFWGCWKVIKPWLDPVVAAKVTFIKKEDLKTYISDEYIPTSYGGISEYKYTFDDKQPTELVTPDAVELSTLTFKYESLQEQFKHVTQQLHQYMDREDSGEMADVRKLKQERDAMKVELNILVGKIDKMTVNKNVYQRMGILKDDDTVDWNCYKK